MNPAVSTGGRAARRTSIYLHRSVRSVQLTRTRVGVALGFAFIVFVLLAYFAVPLMALHSSMADTLLRWSGIPVTGWEPVAVFPGLEPGSGPLVPVPTFVQVSEGARFALILGIVALLIVARRFSLFRNLANFLIALLVVSAVVNVFFDTFQLQSKVFGQIWLRQELLVWLLMPFVSLLLFLLPQPNLGVGLGWMALVQVYGFLFSVLRFVFCVGMLHYTGLLFMPLLWFALGTLSDLLFLLFFYSISVYRTSGQLWGVRSSWQSQL
jgi:hypothetical protein